MVVDVTAGRSFHGASKGFRGVRSSIAVGTDVARHMEMASYRVLGTGSAGSADDTNGSNLMDTVDEGEEKIQLGKTLACHYSHAPALEELPTVLRNQGEPPLRDVAPKLENVGPPCSPSGSFFSAPPSSPSGPTVAIRRLRLDSGPVEIIPPLRDRLLDRVGSLVPVQTETRSDPLDIGYPRTSPKNSPRTSPRMGIITNRQMPMRRQSRNTSRGSGVASVWSVFGGMDKTLTTHSSRSSEEVLDIDGQHKIDIAIDVFAMVLIGEEVVAPWKFLMLALFCVACQSLVLYFIGTFNEYIFYEGVWLTPHHHQQWSLTFMRLTGLLLSMLKASGEFSNALALFQAIWLGKTSKRQACRIEAWVALVLQYIMGLLMLATCAQIALSESSPIWSLFKALSAWLVVDMDNFLAVYAVNVLDLHYLDWSWELSASKALKLTGKQSPRKPTRRHSFTTGEDEARMRGRFRSSWHMWQTPRPVSDNGERTYLPRSKAARTMFFGVPMVLIVLEVAMSLRYNVLPFTFITRGIVSNEDAPIMLLGSFGLLDGCCPPKERPLEESFSWNISVLFLMPAKAEELAGTKSVDSPSVFWVVTGGNNMAPSSLQVYDGQTAKGLQAGIFDSKPAVRTQARHWLNNNGYPGNAGEKVYRALRTKPGLQLYGECLAYSVNFKVSLPKDSAKTYKVFVVAQNRRTSALAPEPVVSVPLHVAAFDGCPEGCRECSDEPGRCDRCEVGKHWSMKEAACTDCAPQCNRCDSAGDGRCDEGSCAVGFGRTESGLCAACNVTGCAVCDMNGHVKVLDRQGSAFAASEAEVEAMAQQYKAVPIQAFPSTCDICRYSYGLSKDKRQCKRCDDNCTNCSFRPVAQRPEVWHRSIPAALNSNSHTGHGSSPTASSFSSSSNATRDKPEVVDICDCQECVPGHGRKLVWVSGGDLRYICQACLAANCNKCPRAYQCDECIRGFAYDTDKNICKACPDGCHSCTNPTKCKRNGCEEGYGFYKGCCRRCQKRHCNSCSFDFPPEFGGYNEPACDDALTTSGVVEKCTNCTSGYGVTLNGGCGDCGDSCARCDNAGACTQCLDRFTLNKDLQRCQACGDRCKHCDNAGAGQCDKDGCVDGFQVENVTKTCIPIPLQSSEPLAV